MTGSRTTDRPQRIRPARHIRQKIGRSGGVELAEAIARAEQMIAESSGEFIQTSNRLLDDLEQALAAAIKSGDPEAHRAVLFAAAHEIRGQSGTFDYPLASTTADSLCKFMARRDRLGAAELEYLALYVKAIGAIFRNRLTRDGGAMGEELRVLVAKMTAKI